MPRLVLASGSPRRRAVLEQLGLEFEVSRPDVDERVDVRDPTGSVVRLADQKAASVAHRTSGDACIIGADTVGVHRGSVLGKPRDDADAVRILESLAGDVHHVTTGVAVLRVTDGAVRDRRLTHSTTEVRFHPLSRTTIEAYVATGEPRDKAAAYAIQGGAGPFVASLHGSYHNVVGLPIDRTLGCLHELGYPLPPRLVVTPSGPPTQRTPSPDHPTEHPSTNPTSTPRHPTRQPSTHEPSTHRPSEDHPT